MVDEACEDNLEGNCLGAAWDCENLFDSVRVDYLVAGGARVTWAMRPSSVIPTGSLWRLEFSRAGTRTTDDWEQVSAPVADVFSLLDTTRRAAGMINYLHYRVGVQLGGSGPVVYSEPVPADCGWSLMDRTRASEIRRKFLLEAKVGHYPVGYLLKRRFYGPPCPVCVQVAEEESEKPGCLRCYDTGIDGGYYPSVSCVYAAGIKVRQNLRKTDVGASDPQVSRVLMLNDPPLHSWDVWVNATNDSRWVLRTIESQVELADWPVLCAVELRKLPYTDPIYSLTIPDMLERRGLV